MKDTNRPDSFISYQGFQKDIFVLHKTGIYEKTVILRSSKIIYISTNVQNRS